MNVADVEARLPPGKYAIEDKAGQGAFNMSQATDYAKRSYDKVAGFKLSPYAKEKEYEGIVYVFSRKGEAEAALTQLSKGKQTQALLGNPPGGMHVMYFNAETAELELASELLPAAM